MTPPQRGQCSRACSASTLRDSRSSGRRSARSRCLLLAGRMEQALDLLDTLDPAGLVDELFDQLGRVDLAAQDDLAVLRVDVDRALRHVGVAEDLGLDLLCQGDVVLGRAV